MNFVQKGIYLVGLVIVANVATTAIILGVRKIEETIKERSNTK